MAIGSSSPTSMLTRQAVRRHFECPYILYTLIRRPVHGLDTIECNKEVITWDLLGEAAI